ncbi:response regulator [Larkinella soli]|uniref:response regulator n=1 Tax=Larkinella soli TaxID=1770527 RepID=UPI000FFCB352|nr:response regulator [Larkinella soli]
MDTLKRIYLAEDDGDDAGFFTLAFKMCFPGCEIRVFENGGDLLKEIRSGEVLPTFIFLDVNMPIKNGIDTLSELKETRRLATVPTFLISGTEDEKTINTAYKLGASSYFVKPETFAGLVSFAESFKAYWNLSVPPPKRPEE